MQIRRYASPKMNILASHYILFAYVKISVCIVRAMYQEPRLELQNY